MKYKEGVERNVGVRGGCMFLEMVWIGWFVEWKGCLEVVWWENK